MKRRLLVRAISMLKSLTSIISIFFFCSFSNSKPPSGTMTTVNDTLPVMERSQIKWDDISKLTATDSALIAISRSGNDFIISRADYENHSRETAKIGDPGSIFTRMEIEPEYPGGRIGWSSYLKNNLRYPGEAVNAGVQGTLVVMCIVDQDGSLHDVQAVSGPVDGGLRDEAVRLVKESGKWHPAIQNFRLVNAYKKQAVTFRFD